MKSDDKELSSLPVVEDEDYAATVGKRAPLTESGSAKTNDGKSKAGQPNADHSAKEGSSKSMADKPEKEKGRKLQKVLRKLRNELKEKSSKSLLDKAEKLAKSIFKKGGKDGNGGEFLIILF